MRHTPAPLSAVPAAGWDPEREPNRTIYQAVSVSPYVDPASRRRSKRQAAQHREGLRGHHRPGLDLAFRDRCQVSVVGKTIFGENAKRDIRTCGHGAYVVLKSLAFRSRGENEGRV